MTSTERHSEKKKIHNCNHQSNKFKSSKIQFVEYDVGITRWKCKKKHRTAKCRKFVVDDIFFTFSSMPLLLTLMPMWMWSYHSLFGWRLVTIKMTVFAGTEVVRLKEPDDLSFCRLYSFLNKWIQKWIHSSCMPGLCFVTFLG